MSSTSNYRSAGGQRLVLGLYQRILDAWPVPHEERMLTTRHGDAFVVSFGDPSAPPLVLLHGAGANSSTWAGDAPPFASAFRVYAVDLPGETGKSSQERPPYAGSTYVDWLTDVFDGLGLDSAMIASLSLGGWVALKFAAASPARVQRLALISPGGIVSARKTFLLQAALFRLFGDAGIRRMATVVFGPQTPPPGVAEVFTFMAHHFKFRTDPLPLLVDAELRRVTTPTFFIGGLRDALLDMPATGRRLSKLLPDLQSELVPNGGHALLGFVDPLMAFLAPTRSTG